MLAPLKQRFALLFLIVIWGFENGEAARVKERKSHIERKLDSILDILKSMEIILANRPTTLILPDLSSTGSLTKDQFISFMESLPGDKKHHAPKRKKKRQSKHKKPSKKDDSEIPPISSEGEVNNRFANEDTSGATETLET